MRTSHLPSVLSLFLFLILILILSLPVTAAQANWKNCSAQGYVVAGRGQSFCTWSRTTLLTNPTNAAVLGFDVAPSSGTVRYDYIFASEEYPEYLLDLKNDAVAIFVDGENIAWVPGTSDPVSVFTVNDTRAADYFRANPQAPNSVFDLQHDGFTSTHAHPWLTASKAVQAGVLVHVRIVIADEQDGLWDSAFFLKAARPIPCQ